MRPILYWKTAIRHPCGIWPRHPHQFIRWRAGGVVWLALCLESGIYGYAAAQRIALSPSEVFQRARASVVVIVADNGNGGRTALGSGFIVATDRVASNYHVVSGTSRAYVIFADGTIEEVAGVVADSASRDLVALAVPTGKRRALPLANELDLREGDPVLALGAPRGLELSLTDGIVSSFRTLKDQFLIQTTAPIAPGSSGGPLLNRQGGVVGITTSLLSDTPGVYFSIGAGDLKRLLKVPQLVVIPFADWAKEKQQVTTSTNGGDLESILNLVAQAKYDEAKAKLSNLIATDPKNAVVWRLLGIVSTKTGETDDAMKEFSRALALDPTEPFTHASYSALLYQTRRYGEALTEMEIAYGRAPSSLGDELRALIYYANRYYDKAKSIAASMLAKDPNNKTALEVLMGAGLHGPRQSTAYKSATNYAKTLAQDYPNSFWPVMARTATSEQAGRFYEAVPDLEAAKKDPFPDAWPYHVLSSGYLRNSEVGGAANEVAEGLEKFPGDPTLLLDRMFISLIRHDITQANKDFRALGENRTSDASASFTGCLFYYGTNQPRQALPYCERSASEDPQKSTLHSNYGWAALDANQLDVALREFRQAQKVASNDGRQGPTQTIDLTWGLILSNYYSGDRKDARKLFRWLQKSYPIATSIPGLERLPLVWSDASLSRVEGVLSEFER